MTKIQRPNTTICRQCKKDMRGENGLGINRGFCSAACKQKEYRERKKAGKNPLLPCVRCAELGIKKESAYRIYDYDTGKNKHYCRPCARIKKSNRGDRVRVESLTAR